MENKGIINYQSKIEGSAQNVGDHGMQNISSTGQGENATLFEDLQKFIRENVSEDIEDSVDNASKLQKAVEEKQKSRAKKIFSWLPLVVQASSVGLQINGIIEKLQN